MIRSRGKGSYKYYDEFTFLTTVHTCICLVSIEKSRSIQAIRLNSNEDLPDFRGGRVSKTPMDGTPGRCILPFLNMPFADTHFFFC